MARSSTDIKIIILAVALCLPLLLAPDALAQTSSGDVAKVESFIRNVITVIAGLAGLVATGFFVAGGFTYITSSGNPEQLDKASRWYLLNRSTALPEEVATITPLLRSS